MLMKVIFRQGLAKLEVGRLEVGAVHTVLVWSLLAPTFVFYYVLHVGPSLAT